MLGLTLAQFTVLHVAISMAAIFAGFMVVGGMFANAGLGGTTAFFLATTLLTNITGFMFPFKTVTPGIIVGSLSSVLLIVAMVALYRYRLAGWARLVYLVTALLGLYFNMLVLIVQSFQKVPFLTPLAPTGAEPPFLIAQTINLAAFVLLGLLAARMFRPGVRVMG